MKAAPAKTGLLKRQGKKPAAERFPHDIHDSYSRLPTPNLANLFIMSIINYDDAAQASKTGSPVLAVRMDKGIGDDFYIGLAHQTDAIHPEMSELGIDPRPILTAQISAL
jgi:hypothetical protein